MKKFILILFALISNYSFSQWRATTPIRTDIKDITFTDQYTGYALGRFGNYPSCPAAFSLYKSVDAGENWIKMLTDVETDAKKALHFVNSMVGWIAEESSEVLKTTDGGVTWISQTSGVGTTLNDIWFTDLNNGILVGNNGMIQRSTNGGASWTTISTVTSATLTRIYFYSNTLGFISCSDGNVLRTTNGGASWTLINTGASSLYDVCFTSTSIGYAVGTLGGSPFLYTTLDGGLTWTQSSISSYFLTRIFFTSSNVGYIKTNLNIVLKTTDAGVTWTPTTPTMNGIWDTWHEMYFTDDNTGFICGNNGRINKTRDGGLTWENKNTAINDDIYSISAPHKDTAYFGDSDGRIFKTHNGGVTYTQPSEDITTKVNKLKFLSSSIGMIAGPDGLLAKTTDGGNTWVQKLPSSSYEITDFSFPSDSIGYASAQNGTVYFTIDAGETWDSISTSTTLDFLDIYFTNQDTGYVTSSNNVLYTFNGGLSWSQYSPTFGGSIRDVVFPSSNVGYVLMSSGIIRTENDGLNWEQVGSSTSSSYEMWFANDSTGYITYWTGLRKTIDSCSTLINQNTACGTMGNMYTVDMVDGGTYGYSGGGAGGSSDGKIYQLEVPEIIKTEISNGNTCPGNTIFVGFYGKGFFNTGNEFTAQLSDVNGSFASPVVIGTYSNLNPGYIYQSGVITATIPVGTPAGSGYRVRVISSTPSYIGPDNGFDITVGSGQTPSIQLNSATQGTICPGTLLELNTSVTAGGLNPNYLWTINGNPIQNNSSSLFIDSLINGDQVQVTLESSLGCVSAGTAISNIFTVSSSSSIDIGLTEDTILCHPTTFQLNANPGHSYEWSPSAGLNSTNIANPTATITENITYTLLLTNAAGCSDSDSVSITLNPDISILTSDTAICNNDSIQLEATLGGTYSWTPSTGLDNPNISNPKATISGDITYNLVATSTIGCTYIDSIDIIRNPIPVIQSNDTTVCVGTQLTLNATPGGTYNWTPSFELNDPVIANPIATLSGNIKYFLDVTSAEGCTNVDSISLQTFPQPTITELSDSTICQDDCIVLTPVINTVVQAVNWSTSSGLSDSTLLHPTACPNGTTNYIVSINDTNGCITLGNINITVNPLPTTPSITFNDSILSTTSASQYQWYFNGAPIPGATNMTFIPVQNGQYTVEVFNTEGCSQISSVFILSNLDITNLGNDTSITFFPNPVKDKFYIKFSRQNCESVSVTILDLNGRIVLDNTILIETGTKKVEIKVGHLPVGSYYCQIQTNEEQKVVQFIVE